MNYVPKDEVSVFHDAGKYDLILCLSVTKWIHLNYGDQGLRLTFRKIFSQLRPGGKFILEVTRHDLIFMINSLISFLLFSFKTGRAIRRRRK